jgi:hypothetical protein
MLERVSYGLPRAVRGADWEGLYTMPGIGETARRGALVGASCDP